MLGIDESCHQQRRRKGSPGMVSNLILPANNERTRCEIAHHPAREAHGWSIALDSESDALHAWNCTPHKSHHGMDRGYSGAALTESAQHIAAKGTAGMEDSFSPPSFQPGKVSGNNRNLPVGDAEPNEAGGQARARIMR